MTFDELLKLVSLPDAPRVRTDSRVVKNGDIFVAVKGSSVDGHDYIEQAVANGAKYIVSEQNCGDGVIVAADSAEAAGLLAQMSCGEPASKLINLAVTGTNGKTTIAYLVHSVIRNAGQNCGLIGTIVYDTGLDSYPATLTTPDAMVIAEKSAEMVKAGAEFMVLEASSHALSQNRLAGIDFKAAAFTNLTGDHLDYHKTEQEYLAAKARLFEKLSPESIAVLNKDSSAAEKLAAKTEAQIIWYSIETQADLTGRIESMDTNGTVFTISYGGQRQKVRTSLLGRYNVSNALAAAGLCLAAGFDLATISNGLSALEAVPGRLEAVQWDGDFSVLIDYAHTDDALKNVLLTLKPLCEGRLIVVFGCGGDRDSSKRPRMAAVAERLADIVVVTSDNPRTEQPEYIIGEIVTGFDNPVAETVITELERETAIRIAIEMAGKDDVVLIAGKGHETYQILGDKRIDFSDKEVAARCLADLK
ncbi:UDP-N-acetylmuramoyl-L-alanyl-D-glutamate--2,6-diaminopimelate ligase [Planctomycetota bacterium]